MTSSNKFQPINTLEQLDSHIAKYGITPAYFYHLADKRRPRLSNPAIASLLEDEFKRKPHSQTIGFWRKKHEELKGGQTNTGTGGTDTEVGRTETS